MCLDRTIPAHRDAILRGELPPTRDWFFDEIHRYRGWRNFLKGLYDEAGARKRILVTGSPLSLNALREDLQVSHPTVARWLEVLERLYAIYRVAPFGAPRLRAVAKAQKHYHFDWSVVADPAARFENLAASHLLK